MDYYTLNERDLAKIRMLITEHMNRIINTTNRPGDHSNDHQEQQAPEFYIARAPADGIPALVPGTASDPFTYPDIPGSALCQIYRIKRYSENDIETDDSCMWQTPLEIEKVYNLSQSAIPENAWVPINRDKSGDWIAHLGVALDSRVVVDIEVVNNRPSTTITIFQELPSDENEGTNPAIQFTTYYDEDLVLHQLQETYPQGTNYPPIYWTDTTVTEWNQYVVIYDLPYSGTGTESSSTTYHTQVTQGEITNYYTLQDAPSTFFQQYQYNPDTGYIQIKNGVVDPDNPDDLKTGVTNQFQTDPDTGELIQYQEVYTFPIGTGTGTEATGTVTYAPLGSTIVMYGDNVDLGGSLATGSSSSSASPVWTKVNPTVTHTDLTDTDTQQDVLVYTIPANTVFHGSIIKTKTVGSGGGVGSLTHQLLIDGNTVGTSGDGLSLNNTAAQFLGGTSSAGALIPTLSTTTRAVAVRFTANVNLDTLSGGEWEVFLLLATLP